MLRFFVDAILRFSYPSPMEKFMGYTFRLQPKPEQSLLMRRFAGCCRFVWNRALALEKDTYEREGKRFGYYVLAGKLKEWKKEEQTVFLVEAHSQILQQTLRDLDQAYKNFFDNRASFPRFRKKGRKDSFRFPQGVKLDEGNRRIYLPKIGWVRYRKSRNITGEIRSVTVACSAGEWNVSVLTRSEVTEPVHPSSKNVGIDLGITRFATLSDGEFFLPVNSYRKNKERLAILQKRLSRQQKFSSRWSKTLLRVQRLHVKIANIRKDFLHKFTSHVSKNHAVVVMEDLRVKDMSQSAAGSVEHPGTHVSAKSGLNLSILDQGWGECVRQLGYKLRWLGGELITVPPQYTSQRCSRCGHVAKDNRKTQSSFLCTCCGFRLNADHNAAINILAAGQAASARRDMGDISPSSKREPAFCVAS